MSAVEGALTIALMAVVGLGLWHGNRMYLAGVAAGRRREALDAQHARDRFVSEARTVATLAYVKASQGLDPFKEQP